MKNVYFEINENFENIINKSLLEKDIYWIKPISTGWTNIVFEVSTNDGNFFFRFPRDEFWARTIVKDYEFAKFIYGKTDFNTSKLELLYDNYNRPFSMHKKIPGIALASQMNNLTNFQIDQISNDIAKFMYQLHIINYDEANIFTINNIGLDLSDFLDELLEKHVSKKDMEFWNGVKNHSEKKCLVHGDLNSSNVLLDNNNRVTAIIDFGFGGFGNKYDDLSRIIGRCPNKFKNSIIKNYEKYSNSKLQIDLLESLISTWNNIDNSYINYMRKIGIYE